MKKGFFMKLEDRFSGECQGIVNFDFEHFVEHAHYRTRAEEYDVRDFVYASEILRPRHLIELWELFKKPRKGETLTATAPVFKFDEEQFEVKSHRFDTFADLLAFLDDVLDTHRFVFTYMVSRQSYIDPATFNKTQSFLLRIATKA